MLPPPDPEEEAAIARACDKLKEFFPGHASPRSVVYAIVSAWIIERVKLSIGRVLCGKVAYNLGDSHLRGSLEAALPEIGRSIFWIMPKSRLRRGNFLEKDTTVFFVFLSGQIQKKWKRGW